MDGPPRYFSALDTDSGTIEATGSGSSSAKNDSKSLVLNNFGRAKLLNNIEKIYNNQYLVVLPNSSFDIESRGSRNRNATPTTARGMAHAGAAGASASNTP